MIQDTRRLLYNRGATWIDRSQYKMIDLRTQKVPGIVSAQSQTKGASRIGHFHSYSKIRNVGPWANIRKVVQLFGSLSERVVLRPIVDKISCYCS